MITYTAHEGISDQAKDVLHKAGLTEIKTGTPDIEWVRVKPPTTNAVMIASPTTGKTHLTGIDESRIKTLADIDQKILQEIRSTSEVAIGLLVDIMRMQNGRGDWPPGESIQGKTFSFSHYGRVAKHIEEVLVVMGAVPCVTEMADIFFVTSRYEGTDDRDFVMGRVGELPPRAYIVNPARSELVDREAIIHGLATGKIAGYAEDVTGDDWTFEQLCAVGPYRKIKLTDHCGGWSKEALKKVETALAQVVVEALQ